MGFLQRNSNTASAHNLLVQAQYYDENTRSVKCTRETRGSWVRFSYLQIPSCILQVSALINHWHLGSVAEIPPCQPIDF